MMYLFYYYSDPEFNELLKMRHSDFSVRHEVYDGMEYKNISMHGGFLCKDTNGYNLSFIISIDRVPLFKSSNTSIWSIFWLINELPASVR